jgi:hypothetical protein
MENREREELLLNYVSGALNAQAAASFDEHMLTCAACRQFAHGQKAVWQALDLFEPASISTDFDRRLYQRLEKVSWWDRMVAALHSPMLTHRGLPIAATAGSRRRLGTARRGPPRQATSSAFGGSADSAAGSGAACPGRHGNAARI